MAKYVLVQFDSDDAADAFTNMIMQEAERDPSMHVRATFKKPTAFCDCPPSANSVRGVKWGWWLHKDCAKPKRGSWQHPRNLLDPIDKPAAQRDIYLGVVEGGPKYGKGEDPTKL
jgi:hypothetical protein